MTFLDNYDTPYSIKENEHEYEKDSKKDHIINTKRRGRRI
jgi:hypothetical protein